ncbi:MAG: amino acid permease [Candidatus Omnitrophica bacterium]|nr:amino acid permease [Candidatus Omnitrophota bacterium]
MIHKRKLNLWDIFCIASGAMISSGLFILPVVAYKYAGPSMIISYLIAGMLMIPSVLSQSELLTAMPKSGGTYFFIERSFGPFMGIFGGLSNWFSIALKSAFALVGIGMFLEYFVPSVDYFQIKLVAASFCIIFTLINLFSVKVSARFQNVLVGFLLFSCLMYIVFGIKKVNFDYFSPFISNGIKPIFSVAGMVFICYGGLTKVASIAEDTENPSKVIPIGMFLSFFVVQIIYILCVAITVGILPANEFLSTRTPLTQGALSLGGFWFGIIMSLSAMTAFFSTANAGILSSSRVPSAMAKDGLLPSKFSLVLKKSGIPYVSVISTGLFMLVLILFLDLENLVKTASTLMIILFMFVNLSVIIMRESKIINYRPSFKAPFYPWIQIFALIAYSFLIFEMGAVPLVITISFVVISFIWFISNANKLKRQSALMHLVERLTAKEFVNNTLEDELKGILQTRDNIIKDRFDHLIEDCDVLDLEEKIDRKEFFDLISETFSRKFNMPKENINILLEKREEQSTTVLEEGLALPHIVVEGFHKFSIIMVRARKGIIFSLDKKPVEVAFVLAGTIDERNFHLRSLMAIAQIVREHNFYKNWMRMKTKEGLRMLILSSTRRRDL